MPVREMRFTETCISEIQKHVEFEGEILEMLREAMNHPETFPFDLFGRRKAEHSNPGLTLYFWINDADGSIIFDAFRGPKTIS